LSARPEGYFIALNLRTALEICVFSDIGHCEQGFFERPLLARFPEQRLPQDPPMFFFHRNTMRTSLLLQFLDDLFLNLSDD